MGGHFKGVCYSNLRSVGFESSGLNIRLVTIKSFAAVIYEM